MTALVLAVLVPLSPAAVPLTVLAYDHLRRRRSTRGGVR